MHKPLLSFHLIFIFVTLNVYTHAFAQESTSSEFELSYGNNIGDLNKLRQEKSNPVFFNFNCSCRGEVVFVKSRLESNAKVKITIKIGDAGDEQYQYEIDLLKGDLKPIGLTFGCYVKEGKGPEDVESNKCKSFTYDVKRL